MSMDIKCSGCGTYIPRAQKFCCNCGTKNATHPSPAPEVMGTSFSDRLAEIVDESVTHLTAELAPPKGIFLCNCCGLCAEESKAQLNHAQSCPIGQILRLIREMAQPDPWVDVKVGLPQEDQKVLICYGSGPWITAAQFSMDMGGKPEFGFLGTRPGNGYAWAVTYWRELPAPPETRATEGK